MSMMTTEDLTGLFEDALAGARRKGASAAKIHFGRGETTGCSFEGSRLKNTEVRQHASYAIEVLVNGRKGVASGNDLAALDEMVGRAIALAGMGSVAHFDAYPAPATIKAVRTQSDTVAEMTLEGMMDACHGMARVLKAYDADLFVEADARRDVSEELLVTSGGVRHVGRETMWMLGANVQRTQGTDMLFAGHHRGWREVNDFYDPAHIAERTVEDLRHAETTVECRPGQVMLFVSPEMLQMLLWPVIMGINGRNIAKGDSPLKGRVGEQVLDGALTMVDDPHRDYDWGANAIDADGIPTREATLFRDGVLQGFLYDLDSAGLAGAEPTGNNGCSPYALSVLPGARSSAELLAGITDGLYLKSLIGFGQSNIMNGDFSSNVALGYRIRNGQIVGRVKNAMLAGNIYDMLKRQVVLSADRDPLYRMPYAIIDGATVSC